MVAKLLQRERQIRADGVIVEIVVWSVDPAVPGSHHGYKYRLYAGIAGRTLVRYDNEAGKGDHKHVGPEEQEAPYAFVSMARTLEDFLADVARLAEEE